MGRKKKKSFIPTNEHFREKTDWDWQGSPRMPSFEGEYDEDIRGQEGEQVKMRRDRNSGYRYWLDGFQKLWSSIGRGGINKGVGRHFPSYTSTQRVNSPTQGRKMSHTGILLSCTVRRGVGMDYSNYCTQGHSVLPIFPLPFPTPGYLSRRKVADPLFTDLRQAIVSAMRE